MSCSKELWKKGKKRGREGKNKRGKKEKKEGRLAGRPRKREGKGKRNQLVLDYERDGRSVWSGDR